MGWASSGDLKSFSTGAEEKSRVPEGHREEPRPLRDKEGRRQAQPSNAGSPRGSPRCHSDSRWRQGQRSPGRQADTCLSAPVAALTGTLLPFREWRAESKPLPRASATLLTGGAGPCIRGLTKVTPHPPLCTQGGATAGRHPPELLRR